MPDHSQWLDAVIRLRKPLEPTPTEIVPSLQTLPDIRAVVFDVYGTLVISGSGDVGSADEGDDGSELSEAMAAVAKIAPTDSSPPTPTRPTIEDLHEQIRRSNQARTTEACPKPEVDILEIWRSTLRESGHPRLADDTESVVTLAAQYEARANPTWPMPGARDLLADLAGTNLAMGIVSNAQAFTIPLVSDLLPRGLFIEGEGAGGSHAAHGFDLDLCIFSYRFGQAKPGPRLFDALRTGLLRRGIRPQQTLYVGNDMLNDVWAASVAGLKTAWFAGDGRSCRARSNDARCRSLRPDLVLTELNQLPGCLPECQS